MAMNSYFQVGRPVTVLSMSTPGEYDAIVIGTGAGGGTLAESEQVSNAGPGRIRLSYTPNNVESFNRLKDRWVDVLKKAGHATTSVPLHERLN
jgi:hypothetical protein